MSDLKGLGFKAAGISAGIKKNGLKDLGLIYAENPVSVAGVFTKNMVQAAPVVLDREKVKSGVCRAVIVNSGNANCCTGSRGMSDAEAMTACVAEELGIDKKDVLVSSTGVIGEFLPIEKVEDGVPALVSQLREDGLSDFAHSILTTDKVEKIVSAKGTVSGKEFVITGVAKGSGMIRPDMATMLSYVMTDLKVDADILSSCLSEATDGSFNKITVDGDTSTNDTVFLMASGKSGIEIKSREEVAVFQEKLHGVLLELAKMIVRDGEGATKVVEIKVMGAKSVSDARKVAETVAHSNLVKTAMFGEDANWGRIIGAAGRAGVNLDPGTVDIYFNSVKMAENGMGLGQEAERLATEVLREKEYAIIIDLKMGDMEDSVITCDFSIDYVKINADYRS